MATIITEKEQKSGDRADCPACRAERSEVKRSSCSSPKRKTADVSCGGS